MLRKTLNSEIMKNSLGRVRVAKKKFGLGRVAGTRQGLVQTGGEDLTHLKLSEKIITKGTCCVKLLEKKSEVNLKASLEYESLLKQNRCNPEGILIQYKGLCVKY